MNSFLACFLLAAAAISLPAQEVPTEWDAKTRISTLRRAIEEIESALDKTDRERWKAAGAAEAYFSQFNDAKPQFGALQRGLADLHSDPVRIGLALEVLLRFEAVDYYINSLREAARKFDDPAVADVLDAKVGDSLSARDRFRGYVIELARDRDTQYAILLKEAQRCRTEINTPAPPKKRIPTPTPTPASNKP